MAMSKGCRAYSAKNCLVSLESSIIVKLGLMMPVPVDRFIIDTTVSIGPIRKGTVQVCHVSIGAEVP